jgi:UDP-glucuronate decarboxylase
LRLSSELEARLRADEHRILVTGAGGWLGRATLELLDAALGDAFEMRVSAFASSERGLPLSSGRVVPLRLLDALDDEPGGAALLFHYAYLGKEKVAEYGAERFVSVNRAINDRVLTFCERTDGGGVFFASSGAAYFAADSETDRDREPYGAEKVRDEQRFLQLQKRGTSVFVSRIFNMSGPFINKIDIYALSCIILDLLNGRPIVLRASNRVYRSFVHVKDVVELAVRLLLGDACPPVPIDAAGEEVLELGELALRCASVLGIASPKIVRPPLRDDADDRYLGDGKAFHRLGYDAGMTFAPLDEQIRDTSAYLAAFV